MEEIKSGKMPLNVTDEVIMEYVKTQGETEEFNKDDSFSR